MACYHYYIETRKSIEMVTITVVWGMEAADSSETSAHVSETKCCHMPVDRNLYNRHLYPEPLIEVMLLLR